MSFYKLPLVFMPQPEGGYTVTCPLVPELLTEGDTLEEAHANVVDAVAAVIEIYEDARRELPACLKQVAAQDPVWAETLVAVP